MVRLSPTIAHACFVLTPRFTVIEIFKSISHVAIGAYLWEAFSSVGFEWSLITRKRAFKWPMLVRFQSPQPLHTDQPLTFDGRFLALLLLQMDARGFLRRNVSAPL